MKGEKWNNKGKVFSWRKQVRKYSMLEKCVSCCEILLHVEPVLGNDRAIAAVR
jgi:hypothetical protein